MIRVRNLGAIVALGALTALPACSMFGGSSNGSGSQYSQSQYRQSNTAAPGSYNTASNVTGTSGTVAPVSPDMIRKVQTALQQNGGYKGQVDGVWGPRTESGVRNWQQAHNLTSSGEIDMATLQSMNISADNQAANQSDRTNDNNTAATQPTGNPNYSTNANRTTGSSYSSNANQAPANAPNPADQGTTNTATSSDTTGNPVPNNTSGNNPTH